MSGSATRKVHKDWDADQFSRPTREGDTQLEVQGMAPIPEDGRYGRKFRLFTVWFAPNLVPAAVFTGTLATADFIGLSLWWGILAIVLGNILGNFDEHMRLYADHVLPAFRAGAGAG